MVKFLIIVAVITFVCIFLNKVSDKVGVPVLLLFLMLGVLYGWSDSEFATLHGNTVNDICSVALIFIMFYGGFGTRWVSAKPIVVEAGLLATAGVALTALFIGLFCHFIMHWSWVESLLMGSVISSTDAASVFAILRRKKLGLKNNTAPLVEMESGSNDPMSFMLTTVMLTLITTTVTPGAVAWDIVAQLVFGAICGLLIAQGAVFVLRRIDMSTTGGYDSLYLVAVALFSYAIANVIGGNGYLSVYIVGIILGNTEYKGRKALVDFFNATTSFMQILIFFLLGMLAVPSKLLHAVIPAMIIFLVLTFIVRPLAVSIILSPFGKFKKYKWNEIGLISFVGLRGAASIVFAIMIFTQGEALQNDIFSIVFCIVLFSISLQGSLIPFAAKKLDMIDRNSDIMMTFSDFSEDEDVNFGRMVIHEGSPWDNMSLKNLRVPKDFLVVTVKRGKESFIPSGSTVFHVGDEVIFCSHSYSSEVKVNLRRHVVSQHSKWIGTRIGDFPRTDDSLVVMIKRGDKKIIPNGNDVFQPGDILIVLTP